VSKVQRMLGYETKFTFEEGIGLIEEDSVLEEELVMKNKSFEQAVCFIEFNRQI
jgi:hypothetical protein